MTRKVTLTCLAPLLLWQCARSELAHVDNVRLADRLSGSSVAVELDVRWMDSFRNTTNWDAAWIVVKFRIGAGPWRHASLSTQPADVSIGNDHGVPATVEPAPDGRGVFVFRRTPGTGPVNWDDVRVRWNHSVDGVSADDEVKVRAVGINMVYIPAGPFVLGDGEGGDVRGHFRGSTSALPFAVTSEAAIPLGGTAPDHLDSNDGYGMFGSFADDFGAALAVRLPPRFPKGHAAFYVMKYELNEGLYAKFLNTLDEPQQRQRNPAGDQEAARPGVGRYTLSATAPFTSAVPDRAAHFLSWTDGAAFADWAAMRPMTELEFEKASRGPAGPTPGEFAWGTDDVHQRRYSLTYIGTPQERVGNAAVGTGNSAYVLTTGGTRRCPSCLGGPLNVDAFSRAGSTRAETGASHYGVIGLSGNLFERVVTIGNPMGRRFAGTHGDGLLNQLGNAAGPEVARWPGSTATGDRSQVVGAVGTGMRGGSWASPAAQLRTSDREFATTADNSRIPTFGYRFVRTAPPALIPGN